MHGLHIQFSDLWFLYKYTVAVYNQHYHGSTNNVIYFVSMKSITINHSLAFMQLMLLGSSQQLPQHALVVPSPSGVLLLETWVELPFGEWVGTVSVPCHTGQTLPLFVGLTTPLELSLVLGLQQVLLPSHQHWVGLQLLHWMIHWLSAFNKLLLYNNKAKLTAPPSYYWVSIYIHTDI